MNHDSKDENLFNMIGRCAMHEDAVMISDTMFIRAATKEEMDKTSPPKEETKNAA